MRLTTKQLKQLIREEIAMYGPPQRITENNFAGRQEWRDFKKSMVDIPDYTEYLEAADHEESLSSYYLQEVHEGTYKGVYVVEDDAGTGLKAYEGPFRTPEDAEDFFEDEHGTSGQYEDEDREWAEYKRYQDSDDFERS